MGEKRERRGEKKSGRKRKIGEQGREGEWKDLHQVWKQIDTYKGHQRTPEDFIVRTGALKMREWKMQEWKIREQITGVENAGAITCGNPSEEIP